MITCSTTPLVRSGLSRTRDTWLVKFCTAQSRPASSTMPSTLGTLTPLMVLLAPDAGFTVYSAPLPECATIRVLPSAVAAMPFRLKSPLVSAAGPLSPRTLAGPGTPAELTGTKKSRPFRESVNHAR